MKLRNNTLGFTFFLTVLAAGELCAAIPLPPKPAPDQIVWFGMANNSFYFFWGDGTLQAWPLDLSCDGRTTETFVGYRQAPVKAFISKFSSGNALILVQPPDMLAVDLTTLEVIKKLQVGGIVGANDVNQEIIFISSDRACQLQSFKLGADSSPGMYGSFERELCSAYSQGAFFDRSNGLLVTTVLDTDLDKILLECHQLDATRVWQREFPRDFFLGADRQPQGSFFWAGYESKDTYLIIDARTGNTLREISSSDNSDWWEEHLAFSDDGKIELLYQDGCVKLLTPGSESPVTLDEAPHDIEASFFGNHALAMSGLTVTEDGMLRRASNIFFYWNLSAPMISKRFEVTRQRLTELPSDRL